VQAYISHVRFIPRLLGDEVRRAARHFPALIITGPRRAGKTTLLGRLFPVATYRSTTVRSARAQPMTLARTAATKPSMLALSIQRTTVTRSCSGSIQIRLLPAPFAA